MRSIATWALLVVAFGWTGTASAVKPAKTDKPFIRVTATPERVNLGVAPFMGSHEVKGAFTIQVEANCLHGPVYVSATALKQHDGASISPKRIFVRTEATNGFVATQNPVAISEPATGSHTIAVDVKVDTSAGLPAGQYNGAISLMIVPPV